MGRYIVKIKDKYLEWSTVCDASVAHPPDLLPFKRRQHCSHSEIKISQFRSRRRVPSSDILEKSSEGFKMENRSTMRVFFRIGHVADLVELGILPPMGDPEDDWIFLDVYHHDCEETGSPYVDYSVGEYSPIEFTGTYRVLI